MRAMTQRSIGEKLQDTVFLLKNTYSLLGQNPALLKPLIRIILVSLILTTLFWGSVLCLFLGTKTMGVGFAGLLIALILYCWSFFYFTELKLRLSWLACTTACGTKPAFGQSQRMVESVGGKIRLLAFLDMFFKYLGSLRNSEEQGMWGAIKTFLINLLIEGAVEIWDLVNHYLIPAIAVDRLTLKAAVVQIKDLRNHVPSVLMGVFGIDFVGDVIIWIVGPLYVILIAIAAGLIYLLHPTNVQVIAPIIIFVVYIGAISHQILDAVVEATKIIYFTLFYTVLRHPEQMDAGMKQKTNSFLKFNDAVNYS
ncbi:MAG: hypothetical protein DCF19_14235 [Pseudanabaena frigida]|uniref:Uncharacterized protein n=1 Tax=Pseudanabaena frigida TaxID=945775 RepID=A0A2W4XXG0_9CYAN|nr:MAG: hypothetical protein DCF19_14115 [Pseudanabaena frigida]PZO39415.1 MAG: hypothetical protein DCF19_14235 [Pseudanabaena frigida]